MKYSQNKYIALTILLIVIILFYITGIHQFDYITNINPRIEEYINNKIMKFHVSEPIGSDQSEIGDSAISEFTSTILGDYALEQRITPEQLVTALRSFLRKQVSPDGTLPIETDMEILNAFTHLQKGNNFIDYEGDEKGNSKKQRVLILTSFHSGSTFTGNLFRVNSEVFYMFEPLQFIQFSDGWFSPRIRQNESNYFLDKLFNCEFEETFRVSQQYYPEWGPKRHGWFGKCFRDKPEWLKMYDDQMNQTTSILSKICNSNYTFTAIKTIRADSISAILPLIVSGVKVLHLIRDPRGLANSRFKVNLINKESAIPHMEMECDKNHRNLYFLKRAQEIPILHKLLLRNYKLTRYEDIAYNTMDRCKDIFKFVGLKLTDSVREWIILNTSFNDTRQGINPDLQDIASDRSKAIATKWRKSIPYDYIRKIEDVCEMSMSNLGFQVLNSESDYLNESLELIQPISNVPYVF